MKKHAVKLVKRLYNLCECHILKWNLYMLNEQNKKLQIMIIFNIHIKRRLRLKQNIYKIKYFISNEIIILKLLFLVL